MKYLILFFAILMGTVCLYKVKYVVSDQIQKNISLVAMIKKTDQELRLLKADWAYLNRPQRLAPLAQKLLGFEPIAPSQIMPAQVQEMS